MTLRPFHLAIPVDDLTAARAFYGGMMGCPEGRSSEQWIDFDLMGHQLVVHLCLAFPAGRPAQPHVQAFPSGLSRRQADAAFPSGLSRRQADAAVPASATACGGGSAREIKPSQPHVQAFPAGKPSQQSNPVDGHDVPVPHFGVVLTPDEFDALAARLIAAETAFVIAPTVRFAGLPGEQRTMFLCDPAGNALEFKAFADDAMLFAH